MELGADIAPNGLLPSKAVATQKGSLMSHLIKIIIGVLVRRPLPVDGLTSDPYAEAFAKRVTR